MTDFLFLGLSEVTQDIEDIKPPIIEHSIWGIVGMLAALLVVALLVYAFWPDRKKMVSPPALPKEWARSELARVDNHIAALNPDEAAFQLSRILRGFLERQYGLRACRQSTEEFIANTAQQQLFDPVQKERLQDFLQNCDRLKFARSTAAATPVSLMRQATTWIDENG
jgi:hypothetical protein